MKREDFDRKDFEMEYGLCNPEEDLATMVDAYVTEGSSLRRRIRAQMDDGNFELAAKYLFVRFIMPFAGREYGLSDDSLGFEEVLNGYESRTDRGKTSPRTLEIINKLKIINRIKSGNNNKK